MFFNKPLYNIWEPLKTAFFSLIHPFSFKGVLWTKEKGYMEFLEVPIYIINLPKASQQAFPRYLFLLALFRCLEIHCILLNLYQTWLCIVF